VAYKIKPCFNKKRSDRKGYREKYKQEQPSHFIQEMSLEKFQNLSKLGIEHLSTKKILDILLWRSWMLTEEEIRKICPKDIAAIPPTRIKHLTPQTLRKLSEEQFQHLSPEQIKAMRPIQMLSITQEHLEVMSEKQIQALLPSQIAALSTDQIFALIAANKLSCMSAKQFVAMPLYARQQLRQLKSQLFPKKGYQYKE